MNSVLELRKAAAQREALVGRGKNSRILLTQKPQLYFLPRKIGVFKRTKVPLGAQGTQERYVESKGFKNDLFQTGCWPFTSRGFTVLLCSFSPAHRWQGEWGKFPDPCLERKDWGREGWKWKRAAQINGFIAPLSAESRRTFDHGSH